MSVKTGDGPKPMINSTAGAVAVRNEKGQSSMQNVKVQRYICGKRPEYAPRDLSDEDSDTKKFFVSKRLLKQGTYYEDCDQKEPQQHDCQFSEFEKTDPRLRRLQDISKIRKHEANQHEQGDSDEKSERPGRGAITDSESDGDDLDDEEIERRRAQLRKRVLEQLDEKEILVKEEEKLVDSEESESEYEEYTDSEEETISRLKPVFVRKCDRVKEDPDEKNQYCENNQKLEEQRKETLKLLEKEIQNERAGKIMDGEDATTNFPKLSDVLTDDENNDLEFETWKLRELKRVKRDCEEREAIEREKMEIDRIHSLTEEERKFELKLRPKFITNNAPKGNFKFLQKYYHRGAFYLDKEEDVYKRDISAPTMEDHFDKTVVPQVMQVKNFGRTGRTKYTHLVDQDTTDCDSPWISKSYLNMKMAAGKQFFEKPSAKKRNLNFPQ